MNREMKRAQAKAEVFSGNSEMKGATHWMKTNCENHRLTATASMELRNGSATMKMMIPPTTKSPRTAAQRFQPEKERAHRETLGISSFSSSVSSRGGRRRSTIR